jgi:hypothetical protein
MRTETKRYKVTATFEFEAPSREAAVAKARVLVDSADAKIRVAEASTTWVSFESLPSA